MAELVKQEEKNVSLRGKGGFGDNPQNINRAGRPKKGQTLTDITREILEEELPSGKTRKEALVRKVLELAYEGDPAMIRLAWAYVDGLPKQTIEGKIDHRVLTYEDALKIIRGEYVEPSTVSEFTEGGEQPY
jgi:hypothetical protein